MAREPLLRIGKRGTTTVFMTPVSFLVEEGRIRPLKERADGRRLFETIHPPGPARHHPGRAAARVFR